jgi:ribosomal-protein-alanine N-acetyltransferase
MSAVLQTEPNFRPMQKEDLDAVMAIESQIYPFPWSQGNFSDSLDAGYSCWVYDFCGYVVGYAVMMLAAGEAHLLNVGIGREWQRQGMGRRVVQHMIAVAREYRADIMFLEVRPSNIPARRLYEDIGFNEMGLRKKYYPAENGREDAILMGLQL